MDQKKACLEVEETMGRDVREEDYGEIMTFLSQWMQDCDKVMANLEQQMTTAARQKEEHMQEKQQNQIKQLAAIQQLGDSKEATEWPDIAQDASPMDDFSDPLKMVEFDIKVPLGGRKSKRKTNN